MAIETDSKKLYDTMMETLMDHCGEALYPGDERRIFAEGLALVFSSLFGRVNDRADQARLKRASGTELDDIGEMLRISRLEATPATTVIRFTLAETQTSNTLIPAGSRVTNDGSVYFATTKAAVINAGVKFIDVPAVCVENGTAHNGYPVNSINVLVDMIPFVAGVYNTTVTAGADDGEPYTDAGDAKYRERIRIAPASLAPGTESGYAYYAKSADSSIVDVAVVCPTSSPNTVNIYALLDGGQIPDEAMLQKIVDTINNSPARIMTDYVQAVAPTVAEYGINVRYACPPENETAVVSAVEQEGGVIDQYIAWQSAKLGRPLQPGELERRLYAAGAVYVDVVSPTYLKPVSGSVFRLAGTPTIYHNTMEVT